MFYSAKAAGFYSAEIHGARLIKIVDPAWIRPKNDVVLQPGASVWIDGELVENTGDEPIEIADVPDMAALPDTLEVENPDCLIPDDAVEITPEQYAELLNGQSGGKQICGGADGFPVLVDQPPLGPEVLIAIERNWRDARLSETDGVVSRHRDEVEEGATTTLTAAQYSALQVYRRELRNWPEAGEFPLADHRPLAPPWLAEQPT
jgi:hypothetical protein